MDDADRSSTVPGTLPYGTVHNRTESRYAPTMTTINSDEMRIPRRARDAVDRHERVVVLNRQRPVLVIVHPDDVPGPGARGRGRPVREIAPALAEAPRPDPEFADDLRALRDRVGSMPEVPWAPS